MVHREISGLAAGIQIYESGDWHPVIGPGGGMGRQVAGEQVELGRWNGDRREKRAGRGTFGYTER